MSNSTLSQTKKHLKTNYTITVVLWWIVRPGSQVLWRCWFFRRLWASQEHPEHKLHVDLHRLSRISQGGSTDQETNSAVSGWCSYHKRSWSCSGWGQDWACPCPGFPIAACAALLAEMLCLNPAVSAALNPWVSAARTLVCCGAGGCEVSAPIQSFVSCFQSVPQFILSNFASWAIQRC